MTVRAFAHVIVRHYPQPWRERYEAEVRGLIDDAPMQFRDLGELLRGLFTETARELLMSEDKPRRTEQVVWVATLFFGLAFVGLAALTGAAIVKLTGPWSEPASYSALVAFCLLAVVAGRLMVLGSKRREPGRPFAYPPDVAIRILPLVFVASVIYGAVVADGEPSHDDIIPWWLHLATQWGWIAWFAGNQIASFLPGRELLRTLAALSFAETQLRTNEQWVAGCRDMISKGVPSPLNEALQQVGKWTLERDGARQRLKELGYRARFRGPVGGTDDSEPTA